MVKTPSAAKLVLAEIPVFELTFGLATHESGVGSKKPSAAEENTMRGGITE